MSAIDDTVKDVTQDFEKEYSFIEAIIPLSIMRDMDRLAINTSFRARLHYYNAILYLILHPEEIESNLKFPKEETRKQKVYLSRPIIYRVTALADTYKIRKNKFAKVAFKIYLKKYEDYLTGRSKIVNPFDTVLSNLSIEVDNVLNRKTKIFAPRGVDYYLRQIEDNYTTQVGRDTDTGNTGESD